MDRFPPTTNPRIYTLSSLIIGYALIDGFTANEQNAIGNWFMTIGQVLEANAAFQQTMEERIQGNTININGKNYKECGDPYMHNPPLYPTDDNNNNNSNNNMDNDLEQLKKIIKIMQEKLDELQKKN